MYGEKADKQRLVCLFFLYDPLSFNKIALETDRFKRRWGSAIDEKRREGLAVSVVASAGARPKTAESDL